MTLLRVSNIDIKRLNHTAVKPILLSTKLSPNPERANKRVKNIKNEKAKTMCEPDFITNRNSNRRILSILIICSYVYLD